MKPQTPDNEVARLRELLTEFYDTLDIGGYHHSLCNIQTEDPEKWDLGCNCEIADLKKKYIELMSTAPAPEEPVKGVFSSKKPAYSERCRLCGDEYGWHTGQGDDAFCQKKKEPAPEWRELGVDEVICEGDKYRSDVSFSNWPVSSVMIGKPARNFPEYSFHTNRPMSKQEEMPLEDDPIEPLFDEEIALIEKWGCSQDPFRSVHAQEAFVHVIHAIRCLDNEIQQHEDMFTTWIKATEDQRREIRYLRDEIEKLKAILPTANN